MDPLKKADELFEQWQDGMQEKVLAEFRYLITGFKDQRIEALLVLMHFYQRLNSIEKGQFYELVQSELGKK